jgi:DNA-binding CsgD family transcriptional regulator/PAS domain-containing protein
MPSLDPPHDQLIEQLYEGVLTEDGWHRALEGIVQATGSAAANTIVLNPQQAPTGTPAEFVGHDPEVIAVYENHYGQIDEALPFAPALAFGQWYHDERDLSPARMRRSEYYQDFLLPRAGMSTTICNRLLEVDGTSTFLSLHRRPGQPGYTRAELQTYCLTFIPHVQRTVRLRLELDRMTGGARLASLALDRLPIPVLVLDGQGRILQSSTQAQTLMRRTPELAVRHGRLMPQGMKPGQFDRLVQSACGHHGPAVAGGARLKKGAHQTRGERGQAHTLQCLVVPLPVPASKLNPWSRPLALVLLHELDPPRPPQMQPGLMRQLFNLTPAESKVALVLSQGDPPAKIAERLGLSITTVRGHLNAIFAKTGTARQADLIRLLTLLSALDGEG